MPKISLPFGSGIDRAAGRMVVRPGAMRDARNVYLADGKVMYRGGLTETAVFTDEDGDPVSHIMAVYPQRTERVGIVVGYQGTADSPHLGKAYIYRVTALGEDPERLLVKLIDVDSNGVATPSTQEYWFQLTNTTNPPVVIATDTYGKVVLAHDEPNMGTRAGTVYYDSNTFPNVQPLMSDLDNQGYSRPIYFRGVVKHLNYLIGWGYGTASDMDRPEYARVSKPGEPTVFERNGYWIVGQRGEPILAIVSGRSVAIAHKESETYRLAGYSAQTFSVQPLDPTYGVVGSRLAMPFDGGSIFWSAEGPRFTDGDNPSVDLAIPLDLEGLEPADLTVAGSTPLGFVAHLTARRVVIFIFGQRGYALSYVGDSKRWSYVEYGVPLYSQGVLYFSTVFQSSAPTGYPATAGFASFPTDFTAIPYVRNVGEVGGELIEAWLRPVGGDWSINGSVDVKAGTIIQQVPLDHLSPGTDYELAFRYRLGGKYTPGYEGQTPDDWTASTAGLSKETFSTPSEARAIDSVVWSRVDGTHEILHVVLSASGPAVPTNLETATDPVAGPWTAVPTTATYPTYPLPIGTLAYDYEVDSGTEGETRIYFRAQPNDGGTLGPVSNIYPIWVGPLGPLGNACSGVYSRDKAPCVSTFGLNTQEQESGIDVLALDQTNIGFTVRYLQAVVDAETEIYKDINLAGYALSQTVAAALDLVVANDTGLIGQSLGVKIRHKLTQFTIADYSDFSPEYQNVNPQP